MSREPLKWHDRNAKDNPAFLDALAKVRDMGVHEGWVLSLRSGDPDCNRLVRGNRDRQSRVFLEQATFDRRAVGGRATFRRCEMEIPKPSELQNVFALNKPFTRDTPLKFDKRTSTVATPMSPLPSKIPASSLFPDCRPELRISRICPASRATRVAATFVSLNGQTPTKFVG